MNNYLYFSAGIIIHAGSARNDSPEKYRVGSYSPSPLGEAMRLGEFDPD